MPTYTINLGSFNEGDVGTMHGVELAEMVPDALAEKLADIMRAEFTPHECVLRDMLQDASNGQVTTEEREDLAEPGERAIVYYMQPVCAYGEDADETCLARECNCEGDVYIAALRAEVPNEEI